MMRRHALVVGTALLISRVLAGGAGVTLAIQEPWGDLFGGQEAVYHVAVSSPEEAPIKLVWRFACEGSTIARSEQVVDAVPGRPSLMEIKLAIPAVKEGVIMPASLAVSTVGTGMDQTVVNRPLWIFPESVFADRMEWLKGLNVRVFDPGGQTAAVFTKAGIPFVEIHNIDAISEMRNSMLIVGEGLSLKEQRGLADVMVRAASAGTPVLCLAPSAGEMPMPGSVGSDQPFPTRVGMKPVDVIAELDKRLDSEGWAPDGRVVARRMAVQGDRAGVVLVAGDGKGGWPWLDFQFGGGGGRLVICGFAIIEKWDSGPTARFLLARILENMAGVNRAGAKP